MIDRERLAELRELHHYDTVVMPLLDTIDKLLTVKEAAESQDYKCPALQMALAAVKEGA